MTKIRRIIMEEMYSGELKKEMLKLARNTVEMYVKERKTPSIEHVSQELKEKRGAFVTLHKKGNLRGCIGYTEPYFPLGETIVKTAVSASTKDNRFTPVKEEELKDIDIEISVLSPVRKVVNTEEIKVGIHGLVVSKGYYSGLLLPQVATNYNWDREEFLAQTCWKAGLPPDAWKDKDCEIYLFSAEVFGEKDLEKKQSE
jgi:AmmeMemoRadiSam system protein A